MSSGGTGMMDVTCFSCEGDLYWHDDKLICEQCGKTQATQTPAKPDPANRSFERKKSMVWEESVSSVSMPDPVKRSFERKKSRIWAESVSSVSEPSRKKGKLK